MTSQRAQAVAALERASDKAVTAVVELLAAYGPEPTPGAVEEAAAWNDAVSVERRQALVEQSITRDKAAQILGVSAQAVSAMLYRGDLAGLKVGREWRLPRWQFDPESATGTLAGLHDILAVFPGSLVALSRWVEIETPDLCGVTPRSTLLRGRVADVLVLMKAL